MNLVSADRFYLWVPKGRSPSPTPFVPKGNAGLTTVDPLGGTSLPERFLKRVQSALGEGTGLACWRIRAGWAIFIHPWSDREEWT